MHIFLQILIRESLPVFAVLPFLLRLPSKFVPCIPFVDWIPRVINVLGYVHFSLSYWISNVQWGKCLKAKFKCRPEHWVQHNAFMQSIVHNCKHVYHKHLLRYWPILARSSILHFAGAVNTRQKITVHIINLVYSEFPNRSCRSVRSFISTLDCT